MLQAFLAGAAASGLLTSALRLITKAAFENSKNGLRKGASRFNSTLQHLSEINCFLWSGTNKYKCYAVLLLLQFYSSRYLHCSSFFVFFSAHFPSLSYQLWNTTAGRQHQKGLKLFQLILQPEASRHYLDKYSVSFLSKVPRWSPDSVYKKRVVLAQKDFKRKGNKELLKENVDYALDMFLIYMLSLSIFPGFLSEDTGSHSLGSWYVYHKSNWTLLASINVWPKFQFCHRTIFFVNTNIPFHIFSISLNFFS